MSGKTYTITFGDVAENHAKMQKIGSLHESGYSIEKLEEVQKKLNGLGLTTEMIDLNVGFGDDFEKGKVLVIRRGGQYILGEEDFNGMMGENDELCHDKMALMRGKVVNKIARHNLCFADDDQEPDYTDGKGRIVSWGRVRRISKIREVISEWTDDVLLNGEANYYYDISKCGIGFHGDGERKKVFAIRMGETLPLYFQWFQQSLPVGPHFEIVLNDGDMYIMSEKAVGFDWLKKIKPTLRHATGCQKYTQIVPKKVNKVNEVVEVVEDVEVEVKKDEVVEVEVEVEVVKKVKEVKKRGGGGKKDEKKKEEKEKEKVRKMEEKEKEKVRKMEEKEKEKVRKMEEKIKNKEENKGKKVKRGKK